MASIVVEFVEQPAVTYFHIDGSKRELEEECFLVSKLTTPSDAVIEAKGQSCFSVLVDNVLVDRGRWFEVWR
jgi:hypothetical protein